MGRCAFFLAIFAFSLSAWPVLAQQKTEFTVATIERKPFAFQNEEGWTGFSIDLWAEVAKEIAVTSNFEPVDKFGDLIDAVKWRDVDIAVANISITYAREQSMDFTQPIFDAGLMVLMPIQPSADIFSAILNRDLLLWIAGAIFLLFIAANLIWLVERREGEEFQTSWRKGVSRGLWWAVNVVTQAGFDIASPTTRAGRMLAFGLILLGLFVVGAFVAQITAALTVNQIVNQVDGYEDLYGKRVGTTSGSTSANFLTAQSIRYEGYDNIDDMFAALDSGEVDALVHDAPILAYWAETVGKGRFQTVGRVFNAEKYGFALPTNNDRIEEINRALLKLRENGTYDALIDKWFGADYQ